MTHVIPETPPDYDDTRLIERPDGFYWQSKSGGKEFGPFPTLLAAVLDMQYPDNAEIEPEESLEEAEADLGITDWIDPETGESAEASIPRVGDDRS